MGRTIALCLLLALPCTAGDDVTSQLHGVRPEQAERLLAALLQPGKADASADKTSAALSWKSRGHARTAAGWWLRGQLTGSSRAYGSDKARFEYDRQVLVEWRRQGGRLQVTIEEARQVEGKFDLEVSGISLFRLAPRISLESPNVSVQAQMELTRHKVQVANLPYLIRPHLSLDTWGAQRALRVRLGIVWESRAELVAQPVEGTTTGVKVGLSWAGQPVIEGELGITNAPLNTTVTLRSSGPGILARLAYDETVADASYRLGVKLDMSWSLSVGGLPIQKVGSAHVERTRSIGPPLQLLAAGPDEGLPESTSAHAALLADAAEGTQSVPVAERLRALYNLAAAAPKSAGLAEKLPGQ